MGKGGGRKKYVKKLKQGQRTAFGYYGSLTVTHPPAMPEERGELQSEEVPNLNCSFLPPSKVSLGTSMIEMGLKSSDKSPLPQSVLKSCPSNTHIIFQFMCQKLELVKIGINCSEHSLMNILGKRLIKFPQFDLST